MFSHLELLAPDPIYGMQVVFKKDPRPEKINLSIGVCLDASGSKTLSLKAVEEAQKNLLQKPLSKEYLPITGNAAFCALSQELVCSDIRKEDLFTVQAVGGTGGLFLAAKLLLISGIKKVFISDPSWVNHKSLFQAANLSVASYPYYDREKASLDFEALIKAIQAMPPKSAIVLQGSCHNPTGLDPTASQWKALSEAVKRQNLLPIFDLAYLGLGNGLAEDAQGARQFLQDGHEMFIVTTYSKTFGLYNDRIGALTVACKKESIDQIASHIRAIARACYSSPPALGAEIISQILQDASLKGMWQKELQAIRVRLKEQRKLLYDALQRNGAKFPYQHLLKTNGLFCLFDLTPKQVLSLQKDHGIYLALDGRVSLATITEKNVQKIASAL